jgi:hypothetical protein
LDLQRAGNGGDHVPAWLLNMLSPEDAAMGREAASQHRLSDDESMRRQRMYAVISGSWRIVVLQYDEPGGGSLTDTAGFRNAAKKHFAVNPPPGISYEGGDDYGDNMVAITDHTAWNMISGTRHIFEWTTVDGEVMTEREVKFYDMCRSVAENVDHSPNAFNRSMRKLCNVPASITYNGRDGFDANTFWSAVVLYDAVGTTGVRAWDDVLSKLGMKGGTITGFGTAAAAAVGSGSGGGGRGGRDDGGATGGAIPAADAGVKYPAKYPAAGAGVGVSAGGNTNGCRSGNTWKRGEHATAAGADIAEKQRKLAAEITEQQRKLAATLEAKRQINLEQMATLAARIKEEKNAGAGASRAPAAKHPRSSDAAGGFGVFGGDTIDETIGDHYRGMRDQQKRARLEAGVAMSGKRFYAVARGRQTGVFSSWEEAQPHVHGFSGASHKGFRSREEAAEWMRITMSNYNYDHGGGGGGGSGGTG